MKPTKSKDSSLSKELFSMAITKFNFNTNKETGIKRESVEVEVPVLSFDQFVDALNAEGENQPKVHELILSAVNELIIQAAREQVAADESLVSGAQLDLSKLTLEAIASIPPKVRASNAIPKEDFAAFLETYKDTAMVHLNLTAVQLQRHIAVLRANLKPLEYSKAHLEKLVTYLVAFADTPDAEVHTRVINAYLSKAQQYLDATEAF